MPRHVKTPTRGVVAAVALSAMLLGACSDRSTASPVASPPTTTTTTTEAPSAVQVDWSARTVTGVADADVTVDFCEGEAPYLCFTGDDGTHLGVMELVQYPVAGYDAIEEVIAGGGDESAALEAVADDLVTEMAADRAEGCGDGYEVVPDAPVPAVVAGGDGVRYGFRGVAEGTTVEHVVIHARIDDGTVWILAAAGYADDGCLPREGEFDVAGVQSAAPLISELAAGSRLPDPGQATTEGGRR